MGAGPHELEQSHEAMAKFESANTLRDSRVLDDSLDSSHPSTDSLTGNDSAMAVPRAGPRPVQLLVGATAFVALGATIAALGWTVSSRDVAAEPLESRAPPAAEVGGSADIGPRSGPGNPSGVPETLDLQNTADPESSTPVDSRGGGMQHGHSKSPPFHSIRNPPQLNGHAGIPAYELAPVAPATPRKLMLELTVSGQSSTTEQDSNFTVKANGVLPDHPMYRFNFGDGSVEVHSASAAAHRYARAGEYDVSVEIVSVSAPTEVLSTARLILSVRSGETTALGPTTSGAVPSDSVAP
jgi:hypothetical protein